MVTLSSGVPALQLTGVTEGLIWVDGGVYYDVVGPSETFTAADALSVGNAISASP